MGRAGILALEFECHGQHGYLSRLALTRSDLCWQRVTEKSHDESEVDVDRFGRAGAHGQWGKRPTPDRRSNAAE
jgi:hypothetical protein